MKKTNVNEKNAGSLEINYGTNAADVIKTSDVNISVFGEEFENSNDKIVIAKNKEGEFYVTVKSLVDSGLLDPFKCYQKKNFSIKQLENVENGPSFSVKYKNNNPGITI